MKTMLRFVGAASLVVMALLLIGQMKETRALHSQISRLAPSAHAPKDGDAPSLRPNKNEIVHEVVESIKAGLSEDRSAEATRLLAENRKDRVRRDAEYRRYRTILREMKFRTTIEPLMAELEIQDYQKIAFVEATHELLDALEDVARTYPRLMLEGAGRPVEEVESRMQASILEIKRGYELKVGAVLTPEQMAILTAEPETVRSH